MGPHWVYGVELKFSEVQTRGKAVGPCYAPLIWNYYMPAS